MIRSFAEIYLGYYLVITILNMLAPRAKTDRRYILTHAPSSLRSLFFRYLKCNGQNTGSSTRHYPEKIFSRARIVSQTESESQ